jgi:hypothetical protein
MSSNVPSAPSRDAVAEALFVPSVPIFPPAWANEVVSSNIVGYEKISLTADKFVMSAAQFEVVGGGGGTLSDLFSATDIPFGTEVRLLNEKGQYEMFTYLEEAYDEDLDDYVPGWANGDEYLVSDPVSIGTGFWVSSPENYNLTQSGQVATDGTVTLTLTAGMFQMIADPFPEGFNPNAVTWGNLEYGTEIRVLNAQGQYVFYTYLEEAYDEDLDYYVPGWADGDEYLVKANIANEGQGFWIKSDTATTITFSNPTAKAGN